MIHAQCRCNCLCSALSQLIVVKAEVCERGVHAQCRSNRLCSALSQLIAAKVEVGERVIFAYGKLKKNKWISVFLTSA